MNLFARNPCVHDALTEGRIQSFKINKRLLEALWNSLKRLEHVPECSVTIGIGIPRLTQFEVLCPDQGSSHVCELRILDKSVQISNIYPLWISAYIDNYLEKNEISGRCNPAQIEGIVYNLKHQFLDRLTFNIQHAPISSPHEYRPFVFRISEDCIHLIIYKLQSFAKECSQQKLTDEIRAYIAKKSKVVCQSVVFYKILSKRIEQLFTEINEKLPLHQLFTPYSLLIAVPRLKKNGPLAEELELISHVWYLKSSKKHTNSIINKKLVDLSCADIEKNNKISQISGLFSRNVSNKDLIYVDNTGPQSLSKINRRLLALSKNAIDIIPPEQRQIHALTLNTTYDSLEKVKQHMVDLQSQLVDMKSRVGEGDLLCAQSQLFPITRPVPNSKQKTNYYYGAKEWSKTIIRELITLQNFKFDPQWIRSILYPRIPIGEIKKVLEFLLNHKIIVFDSNRGKYVPSTKNIMTEQEVQGDAAIRYQHSLINLAIDLIEEVPSDEFLYYKTMIAIDLSSEHYQDLKELILDHLTNIFNLCQNPDPSQRIYQLNLQAFPINIKI